LEGINTALGGESSILVFYEINQQRSEALIPVTDINQQLIGIVGVTDSLEGVATEFGQLRWLVMIALLVEILLAVAIALFLAGRLARPITSVTESVTEIALGQRIEPVAEEGPLEIRQLAASVNILAERLHTLEDTRRRLLANLVHELGRPLGAIRAAIHTLRQGAAEDPQIREELLAGMEDEVIRMQPLLDDLAQLHGQVLGTLELNREPTALSEWLPSVLLPWRAAVLEKGIRWQATIPPGLPTVDLDPGRMAQVVGNLLSNAIKYTPADGSVQVTAGADQEKYWFRVADSGPGIMPEEQEKVFEPFFRSTQQRRFPQGLGLGLTIARDLVEAHGGTLEVESDPEKGSEFTARLPIN
jgi:signal transduction histidine kinase